MIRPVKLISLDRTPQRLSQFLEWNPGIRIERFPAFDGARLDRSACVADGLITAANTYSPGAIGNALSHVTLWRQCAAGSVPFHIAEDDVILRADFHETAEAVLAPLADWTVVLWGHNLDWPVKLRPAQGLGHAVVHYDQEQALRELPAFRSGSVRPLLTRLTSAAGICCYSVTPGGARRMLADCLPIGSLTAEYAAAATTRWNNTALDVEMSRHYEAWNAYLAFPSLAFVPNDAATSTVRGSSAPAATP